MNVLLDASHEVRQNIMDGRVIAASKEDAAAAAVLAEQLTANNARYRAYKSVLRRDIGRTQSRVTATGEVLGPTRNGPAVELTLGRFVRGGLGDRARIKNYKAAFQMVPSGRFSEQYRAGMQSMEDYLVAAAYDYAGATNGGVGGAKLNTFRTKYRIALEEFPGASERLSSASRLEDEAKTLGKWRDKTITQVNRNAVNLFIEDPEGAVARIFSVKSKKGQRKAMEILKHQANAHAYKDSRNGLRSIVWGELKDRATRDTHAKDAIQEYALDGGFVRKQLDKHSGVFEALYTPKELEMVRKLSYQIDANNRITIPSTTRPELAWESESPGMQLIVRGKILSPIWSAGRKAFHTARAGAWMHNALLTTESGHVMQAALNDPMGLGLAMLAADTPATRRRLRKWIGVNMSSLLPRLMVERKEETSQ
jgi:hypothetical protein